MTVTSSSGGSDTAPVSGTGPAFAPVPLTAAIGANAAATVGQQVTLDGTSSSGDIVSYAWTQTAGPTAALTVAADSKTATFIAPAGPAELTYQLTVRGSSGISDTTAVTISISDAPAPAPVANAGPDQSVKIGATVTLNASASTNVTSYAWTQTSGPAATLSVESSAGATPILFPVVTVAVPSTRQRAAQGVPRGK